MLAAEIIMQKVGRLFLTMCIHVYVYYSEEGDVSPCAVPISSALIKQILSKAGPEKIENLSKILEHFYGPKPSTWPPWPYTYKNTDR